MKIQIASEIFLEQLNTMKKILDLIAFKTDKKSDIYKYYKQEIMNYFYNSMKRVFKTLEKNKIIKQCSKKCSLRKGYSNCKCNGSGYINYENN
ncbi:hypothetical protein LCGC14_0910240 [marine sediment metagenome]|uniref:Uncharacterized protein n=1 Tax=marine sediment metagenome TaxID=412755 RepID=A0A0F9NYH5_9ZZZZ